MLLFAIWSYDIKIDQLLPNQNAQISSGSQPRHSTGCLASEYIHVTRQLEAIQHSAADTWHVLEMVAECHFRHPFLAILPGFLDACLTSVWWINVAHVSTYCYFRHSRHVHDEHMPSCTLCMPTCALGHHLIICNPLSLSPSPSPWGEQRLRASLLYVAVHQTIHVVVTICYNCEQLFFHLFPFQKPQARQR